MRKNLLINGEAVAASQEGALVIELFLNDNYRFRRNVLNGKVEILDKRPEVHVKVYVRPDPVASTLAEIWLKSIGSERRTLGLAAIFTITLYRIELEVFRVRVLVTLRSLFTNRTKLCSDISCLLLIGMEKVLPRLVEALATTEMFFTGPFTVPSTLPNKVP